MVLRLSYGFFDKYCSARNHSSDGRHSSVSAIFITDETDGLAVPRSTREINERAMSAPFASCSCDKRCSTRLTFTAIPKAVLISIAIKCKIEINYGYSDTKRLFIEHSMRYRLTHIIISAILLILVNNFTRNQ